MAQSREIELLVIQFSECLRAKESNVETFGAFLRRGSENWYCGGTSSWTEVEGTRGDLLLSLQSRQLASAMPAFPLPSRLKQSEQASCGFLGGFYLQLTQEANMFSFAFCASRESACWGLLRVSCLARLVVRTDVSNQSPERELLIVHFSRCLRAAESSVEPGYTVLF
jgi:hypothetical protein